MRTPFNHQLVAARFLPTHEGGCLFDEPGLGKTLSTILACDAVGAQHVLVLCPSVVKQHWARAFREDQRYARPVTVIDGYATCLHPAGVVIASHAATTQDGSHMALWGSGPWDVLIIDEADGFANWTSKRTIRVLGGHAYSLWRGARFVWPLSGTPVVNSAADLYPIMSTILAHRLGGVMPYSDFIRRYCNIKVGFKGDLVPFGVQNADELWAVMAPHMLARKGILDLPPLRMDTLPVSIADNELRPILWMLDGADPAVMEQKISEEDEDEEEAISRVRHALGLAKVPAAVEYISYLVEHGGAPLVVYYIHRNVKDGIISKLPLNYRVDFIDGTNSNTALERADRFQRGELDVLLLQIQAGGVGITLTAASRGVMVEQPWTARAVEQSVKRMLRIGQTRSVLVEVLYADGCWLDALTSKLIVMKQNMATKVLGHDK